MPGSSKEGKAAALEMILGLGEIRRVLDVGPGMGTWYDLLHTWCPDAIFDAIEIFEPYLDRFKLLDKYRHITIGDAYDVARAPGLVLPVAPEAVFPYDLAIFGDVLEHMTRARAIETVWRLPWDHAIISIPLGDSPQGPSDGNLAEAHISTWENKDVLDAFPVVRWDSGGGTIGVYLLART